MAAESLLPLQLIESPINDYLDIGSGGGFPAVPILFSGRVGGQATLVERTQKKAAALKRLLGWLNLTASIQPRTFEEVRFSGRYDLITLRWVKLTDSLLKRIVSLLTPHGTFLHYSPPVSKPGDLKLTTSSFVSPKDGVVKQFTLYTRNI